MSTRAIIPTILVIALAFPAAQAVADESSLAAIQNELASLYQTAKATADGTDIVTAGSVLVLQKDHLVMCTVDQRFPTLNTYKDGAISQNGLHAVLGFLSKLSRPGGDSGAAETTREFVTGEKFWVTEIITRPDGVFFSLMSDPINDKRYKATLRFPFTNGVIPTPDDVAAKVAEVVKIDTSEQPADQGGSSQAGEGQAAQAPPAPPPAQPPVQTKTIAVGQSRDEVIATFGVPSRIVKLSNKEIDYFPDMKVTFVNGKVANVQ